MGILSFSPTSPLPSMGLPRTLRILPKVFSPTGTVTGSPVFSASAPLLSPSVMPIAMVLTTPSPSCC